MSSQRCLGSSSMLADHSSSPFSLNAVQDGQSIPLSSSPMEGFLFCNFLCQSVPLILCNVVFCFWFVFQLVSATVPDAAHDKHCTTGTWGSMQDQGGCDAYHLPVPFCPKLLAGTPVWSTGGHHHRSTWSAAPPRSRSKHALRDLDPLVLLAALEAEEWSCLPWGTQDTEANADGLQGGRGAVALPGKASLRGVIYFLRQCKSQDVKQL